MGRDVKKSSLDQCCTRSAMVLAKQLPEPAALCLGMKNVQIISAAVRVGTSQVGLPVSDILWLNVSLMGGCLVLICFWSNKTLQRAGRKGRLQSRG